MGWQVITAVLWQLWLPFLHFFKGRISHLSHSPSQGVKWWQVPNRPFYGGFFRRQREPCPPFQLQFPRKRSPGLLNLSWHTLPQTCNCCRFWGQSLGEQRPSISGLTIWPLPSMGPVFSMPGILSLQLISSSCCSISIPCISRDSS